MKIEIQNLDDKWFEKRNFKIGYGKFPYLLIKTDFNAFMQIPIHFNVNDEDLNYPGIHINGISEAELSAYEIDKSTELHDKLIEVAKSTKKSIDEKRNDSCSLCLVEGPKIGFYFIENRIEFHESIPAGGTLITSENQILAMNVPHYI
ncbi:MAG: hypothetical protein FGM16_03995 [Flavobacterium sp.]|nr:hypothetical protein [Flavobacterium sp.]